MKVRKKLKRPSLASVYVHHIAWGIVSLALLAFSAMLWLNNQDIKQQSMSLEQQLASLQQPSCEARVTWKSNTTKLFTISSHASERSYRVHLPADFDANRYYPAVFYFPGRGGSSIDGDRSSGVNTLPVIAIYPEPTKGIGGFAWQGAPYSSPANDVQFVSDILDRVNGQLCIKRDQVYAMGMSNGGGLVSLLSCYLSDRFTAFGVVGAAFYYPASDCTPKHPRPFISVHGDNDSVVPYNGSFARKLPGIEQWSARRALDNGCSSRPFVVARGTETITTWQFCRDNATVQNIRIHGGKHVWTADAPTVLWQFLSR